jgi:hypothetical protein
MRLTRIALITGASTFLTFSVAGSAQAITFTAPITSAPTLTGTPSTISFPGTSTFAVPPGYFLTKVALTLAGTTGGSVNVENYSPFASSTASDGLFTLSANNVTNGQPGGYTTTIIPSASLLPVPPFFVPGTAVVPKTTQQSTFSMDIWRSSPAIPGVTPGSTPAYFATTLVNITNAFTSPGPTFTGGASQIASGGNNTTFAISPVLPNSYLTYTFEVPGPLPVLGSAAAFGWSRRLRRRISQAV